MQQYRARINAAAPTIPVASRSRSDPITPSIEWLMDTYGETEYCEMLFQLETEHSDKELYQIIVQYRPVQMTSY